MRHGLWYSMALCWLIMFVGGVGFWLMEPEITSLQDGLWLAFTTAATVGYGDMVPKTHMGRAFSVLVVLLGLAVLSLVTASLAAIFVEREVEEEERQIERDLKLEIGLLREQMRAVQRRLDQVLPPP